MAIFATLHSVRTMFTRHRFAFLIFAVIVVSVLLGFWMTRQSMYALDDDARYHFSQWLLYKYGLIDSPSFNLQKYQTFYGAGWDVFLGVLTQYAFAWLQNPMWVRMAVTWSLFPLTLFGTYIILRRARYSITTSALAVAFLFACTRLGGYATQTKDFPPACAFALLTLYLWFVCCASSVKKQPSMLSLQKATAVSVLCVLPYVLRPPLALHSVLFCCFLVYQAYRCTSAPWYRRIAHVLLPTAVSCVLVYALSPALWEYGFFSWVTWSKPYQLFSAFFLRAPSLFYGVWYTPNALPWWYALGWLPFLGHPIVWFAMLVGCVFCISLPVQTTIQHSFVSFRVWLLGFIAVSWTAVIVLQPTLYDGMRHILFLYMLLPICAGIGFASFSVRVQQCLCMVLIVVGMYTYAQWGRYSYIYMPPGSHWNVVTHFSGDQRMLCTGNAFAYLQKNIPEDSTVYATLSYVYTWHRRNAVPAFAIRILPTERMSQGQPSVQIVQSKFLKEYKESLQNVEDGTAKILWQDVLPTGDKACFIVQNYPAEIE